MGDFRFISLPLNPYFRWNEMRQIFSGGLFNFFRQ